MREQVAVKKQADAFLLAVFSARLQAVNIIPARLIKGVFDKRCAHYVLSLTFGQAGAQLVNHVLRHYVALLDVYFIDAGEVGAAAGG